MDEFQIIGVIIRKRRALLGLTQHDLSEMSGVALRTINALERGKAYINLKNLLAIIDVLGLEINLDIKTLNNGSETGM